MKKVFIAGDVSYNLMIYIDKFPRPETQTLFSQGLHETVGSAGAGKALNLNKLGLEVTFYGLIGDDEYGTKIRNYFERENLAFIYDIDPAGTKRHVNLMDDRGGRISIYITYGSFEPELNPTRLEAIIADSDFVILNIINYCRRLIPLAKKHRKEIWCDIHDYDGRNPYHREFIEEADYLFMSSNALPDYQAYMEHLIDRGKKLVVCTHGKNGSTALTPDKRRIETPIISDYVRKDTNGAGDSFFSGFLYGHSKGYSTETNLRLGTIVSGLGITSSELAFEQLSESKVEREYEKYYGP
ncbi:MAG: carbohydrate kinase family protein [Planctomycetes bacterium]|nr:carbohydrate kinase family protein [Planctomycetota bacterium]